MTRLRTGWWLWLASSTSAGLLGTSAAITPVATLALVGVLGVAAWLAAHPHHSVYGAIVTAMTTVPADVPMQLSVGFALPFYEVLLGLAAVWLLMARHTSSSSVRWTVGIIGTMLGWGILLGFAQGHELAKIQYDVHLPIVMTLAIYVSAGVWQYHPEIIRRSVRLIALSLWFSAVLTILGSAGAVRLTGRSEGTSLFTDASSAATRLLTAATHPAVVVLCVVITGVVIGQWRSSHLLIFAAPASLIIFLGFSRNSIVALIAALGFAFLSVTTLKLGISPWLRAIRGTLIVTTVAIATIFLTPRDSWLAQQIGGFDQRVIGGLESRTVANDPSIRYRERENSSLISAIAEAPILGHGFGYPYQPAVDSEMPFFRDATRYYGHNFYLWSAVKLGILQAALLLLALTRPLMAAARRGSGQQVKLGAAAAGLLVISTVAPMPLGTPTAVLLGALIGPLLTMAEWQRDTNNKAGEPYSHPNVQRFSYSRRTQRAGTPA